MSRDVKIVMDGHEYMVRPFTLGQLERLTDLGEHMSAVKAGFAVVRMAMSENATPPVEKPDDLTPTSDELNKAIAQLLVAAGLAQTVPVEGEALALPGETAPPQSA